MIVNTSAPITPPKMPATMRAASRSSYVGATPHSAVATTKPVYIVSSARLRPKRSIQNAATKPLAAAANVYAETSSPKCRGSISNSRMSCGASGIRIMKSRMFVNCMPASVNSSTSSRGRSLASARQSASPALREESTRRTFHANDRGSFAVYQSPIASLAFKGFSLFLGVALVQRRRPAIMPAMLISCVAYQNGRKLADIPSRTSAST